MKVSTVKLFICKLLYSVQSIPLCYSRMHVCMQAFSVRIYPYVVFCMQPIAAVCGNGSFSPRQCCLTSSSSMWAENREAACCSFRSLDRKKETLWKAVLQKNGLQSNINLPITKVHRQYVWQRQSGLTYICHQFYFDSSGLKKSC